MTVPADAPSKPRGPRPPLPEIPNLNLVPNSSGLDSGHSMLSSASTPQLATLASPNLSLSGRASNPEIAGTNFGSTLPSLGLPQLLDLSGFSPTSSKKEKHDVVICIPYAELANDVQAKDFHSVASTVFGEVTVTDVPISCLVVEPDGPNNAVPTMQDIDVAFQNIEHLPYLIEQVEEQCVRLARQTEQSMSEMEALKAEQQALMVEKAVLAERISGLRQETKQIEERTAGLRKHVDRRATGSSAK